MIGKDREKELLKKVRLLEIKTRGMVNEIFSGEYHTVFKGRGMNFSEVREYSYGDDIRDIDWNVTARMRNPYIKVFEEERELVLMLIVDVSSSGNFGSEKNLKKEIATELGAILAFSAIKNNDKVGLILFSDKIEKFVPPKKGKSHVFRIIRELLYYTPVSDKTSLETALEYFNNVQKKRSTAFLISDFLDDNYEKGLQIASKRHDLIGVELYDERERTLPEIGLVDIYDNETREEYTVDLANRRNRLLLKREIEKNILKRDNLFKKNKVDRIEIDINKSYVKPLQNFFRKRTRKQH